MGGCSISTAAVAPSHEPCPSDQTHGKEGPPADTGSDADSCSVQRADATELSSTSFDLGFSRGAHPEPGKNVVLRIEAETEHETRRLMRLLHSALWLGLGGIIVELTLKASKAGDYHWLRSSTTPIINCTFASLCINLITRCCVVFLRELWIAHAAGKTWSRRRARLSCLYFALLMVQLVNACFYLIPNAYVLGGQCRLYGPVIQWCGVTRWTCWNTAYLLICISAHSNSPWHSKRGEAGNTDTVLDAPLWIHAPKLILWFLFEGNLSVFLIETYIGDDVIIPGNGDDCLGHVYTCLGPAWLRIITAFIGVGIAAWFVLIVYYLTTAWLSLAQKPYSQYRLPNLIIRLQARTSLLASAFISITTVVFWYIRESSCVSYIFTWFGLLSAQVVMSALVTILAYFFMPRNDDDDPMMTALQSFAWTERGRQEQLKARAARGSTLAAEPMFCFETAVKLLFWSILVYEYEEVSVTDDELKADLRDQTLEGSEANMDVGLGSALELFGLKALKVFREPGQDTKALIGWGDDCIVVAFRGTASFANVLNDVQAWRVAHPPARGMLFNGTRPLVHRGFLSSWQAKGLNSRIVDFIQTQISEMQLPAESVRILVTGHSLGGALATLAAHELQAKLGSTANLRCYTFGAPRTGNAAFAREYNQLVPDTWHVIHDQDTVTRMAKFWVLYKRPGQRTIITQKGDIIVRPFPLELRLNLDLSGGKLSHHVLTAYARALVAVIDAQYTGKQLQGGVQGCQELLEDPHVRRFLQVAGLRLGSGPQRECSTGWQAIQRATRGAFFSKVVQSSPDPIPDIEAQQTPAPDTCQANSQKQLELEHRGNQM